MRALVDDVAIVVPVLFQNSALPGQLGYRHVPDASPQGGLGQRARRTEGALDRLRILLEGE
jgi:hypothetical protein